MNHQTCFRKKILCVSGKLKSLVGRFHGLQLNPDPSSTETFTFLAAEDLLTHAQYAFCLFTLLH